MIRVFSQLVSEQEKESFKQQIFQQCSRMPIDLSSEVLYQLEVWEDSEEEPVPSADQWLRETLKEIFAYNDDKDLARKAERWLKKYFGFQSPNSRRKAKYPDLPSKDIEWGYDNLNRLFLSVWGKPFTVGRKYTLADLLNTGVVDESFVREQFRRFGVLYEPKKIPLLFLQRMSDSGLYTYIDSAIRIKVQYVYKNPDMLRAILMHEIAHYLQHQSKMDSKVDPYVDFPEEIKEEGDVPPGYYADPMEMSALMEEMRTRKNHGWSDEKIIKFYKNTHLLKEDFIKSLLENAETYLVAASNRKVK